VDFLILLGLSLMRVQKVSDRLDQMIGRNIRFHRIRRPLSQTALAERIGVAYQQI
jgi:DNA-binding XRE family transcriptional regulator